jgi:hypothetical protein
MRFIDGGQGEIKREEGLALILLTAWTKIANFADWFRLCSASVVNVRGIGGDSLQVG